jgi:hypothetical protein
MKLIHHFLTVCLIALVSVAADAPPATQPATQPDAERFVASNPVIETFIRSIPADAIPPTDGRAAETKEAKDARVKKFKEWGAANFKDRKIKVEAFVKTDSKAVFYIAGMEKTVVEVMVAKVHAPFAGYAKGERVVIEGEVGKGGFGILQNNGVNQFVFGLVDPKIKRAAK